MRGYFGIAVFQPKKEVNIGTLWRTANILGASYLAVIGRRYQGQASDTLKTPRHVPLFTYKSFAEFKDNLPSGCRIVGVEMDPRAGLIEHFAHPQQCCYLLGSEDHGLPEAVRSACNTMVKLRGDRSMNVAVAGSIVMYSRGEL